MRSDPVGPRRALAGLACAWLAAACAGGSPDGAVEPSPVPAPGCAAFAEHGLVQAAASRATLRAAYGEPDSVARSSIANRHVPDQVDTLVSVAYPGLAATFYALPDRDLPLDAEVTHGRWLRYSAPTIGDAPSRVRSLLGEPEEVTEDGPGGASWRYECKEGMGADEAFFVRFRRGTVTGFRFTYYVD